MMETPVIKDLVLIGGGHAHVHVLKMLGMKPIPGVRVSLITNQIDTPYSGMLPGHIAGVYNKEECHIDLGKLCSFGGTRLLVVEACGIDTKTKQILCRDGRPPISYDVCSIDVGISPTPIKMTEAFTDSVTPVKPISEFSSKWDRILDRIQMIKDEVIRLAVIGGGAGGVELCFAIHQRLQTELGKLGKDMKQLEITIYTKYSTLMPSHNKEVQEIIMRKLREKSIRVVFSAEIIQIQRAISPEGGALLELVGSDSKKYAFDEAVTCTSARAQPWLLESDLETTPEGFVCVQSTLESVNTPDVFACGDVAHLVDNPRPKAGVFAVRAGPPLVANLRRRLQGEPLEPWTPQEQFLGIICTGYGYAVSSKGPIAVEGEHQWVLKENIDREWMLGYQQLPDISKMAVDPALEISNRVLLQQVVASVSDKVGDILNHSKMRCGGCGSKIGSQILTRALEAVSRADACATTVDSRTQLGAFRSEVVTGVGDDAALLTSPASSLLTVQTIDYFRSFISDPFLFGKIAANHALSDLHAMNAEPVSALALCVLPFGREEKVENDLVQMIAGACSVLKLENCALVGGHSSEGSEMYVLINALHPFHTLHAACTVFFSSSNKWIYLLLSCLARSMGLSLHGTVHPGEVLRKGPLVSGDVLVLTKALGTGVILAADMRTAAKGAWVSDAIKSMLLSNKRASQILRSRGSSACTDVTGFGLLGHLLEMLQCDRGSAFCSITPHQEKLAAQLYMKDIPLLAGAIECLSAGIISSLQVQVNFSYK